MTVSPTTYLPTEEPDFTVTSGDFDTTISPDEEDLVTENLLKYIQDLNEKVDALHTNQEELESNILRNLSQLTYLLRDLDTNVDNLISASSDDSEGGGAGTRRRRRGRSGGGGGNSSASNKMDFGYEGEDWHRTNWDAEEPILISEGLFAVAKVMSFLRPIALTVMNRHVGPMQISLGGMMFDIAKFLLIFSFVWFAFSVGMNQLFFNYSNQVTAVCLEQNIGSNCYPPFGT